MPDTNEPSLLSISPSATPELLYSIFPNKPILRNHPPRRTPPPTPPEASRVKWEAEPPGRQRARLRGFGFLPNRKSLGVPGVLAVPFRGGLYRLFAHSALSSARRAWSSSTGMLAYLAGSMRRFEASKTAKSSIYSIILTSREGR